MPVQELNKFRRNMIKPYLPPQFAKLAELSVPSQVNKTTYQHTRLPQEGQQAPKKKILISFEQALQVRVLTK